MIRAAGSVKGVAAINSSDGYTLQAIARRDPKRGVDITPLPCSNRAKSDVESSWPLAVELLFICTASVSMAKIVTTTLKATLNVHVTCDACGEEYSYPLIFDMTMEDAGELSKHYANWVRETTVEKKLHNRAEWESLYEIGLCPNCRYCPPWLAESAAEERKSNGPILGGCSIAVFMAVVLALAAHFSVAAREGMENGEWFLKMFAAIVIAGASGAVFYYFRKRYVLHFHSTHPDWPNEEWLKSNERPERRRPPQLKFEPAQYD